MKCYICSKNESKYKCPKCSIKYCSVACYHNHSSKDCTINSQSTNSNEDLNIEQLYPTEDTIPIEKLNLLCYDKQLKKLVSNSFLQEILAKIDNSSSPNDELEKAMAVPLFEEFVRRCLKIVQCEDTT
ncbi:zinc finger HIT domain-containing protein 3 [Daktulosphaira vitifoliae]|uniref:zinc finger HIT domain-containing protein 3 n=1 Tax=Daktulosphaira vitifoliae TaxID=58002 RepID=UPI0021A9DCDB|nr:zinc finger HIT domain-containing protein 3 [Daktulosphaira vitifoliae]